MFQIAVQIQNADFMFPVDPWNEISPLATDLIQRLLRVDVGVSDLSLVNIYFQLNERLNIEECLSHNWLKGEQLYLDLRNLEIRLKSPRYLTSEADDGRYAEFLEKKGIAPDGTPTLL